MITCLCRGVSDEAIRAVIARGARSVAEIHKACGAGGDCGACGVLLAGMVEQARRGQGSAPLSCDLVQAGGRG